MKLDIEKLKGLAEAASECSPDWHTPDDMKNIFSWADADFIVATKPSAVLELIAQIDSGRKKWTSMSSLAGEACERQDQLRAENESLRKDAERYRWLRENNYYAHVQVMESDGSMPFVYSEELDSSLDVAMTQEQN